MSENPPNTTKRVITTVAIVTVICGCSGYLFMNVLVASAENPSLRFDCEGRLKMQCDALALYSTDHDQRLPQRGGNWVTAVEGRALGDYSLHCPQLLGSKADRFGYAANVHVLGRKTSDVADPARMPLTFDSGIIAKNAESGLETLPFPGRHGSTHIRDLNNIAYLDGHVEPLKDDAPKPNDDPMKQ